MSQFLAQAGAFWKMSFAKVTVNAIIPEDRVINCFARSAVRNRISIKLNRKSRFECQIKCDV